MESHLRDITVRYFLRQPKGVRNELLLKKEFHPDQQLPKYGYGQGFDHDAVNHVMTPIDVSEYPDGVLFLICDGNKVEVQRFSNNPYCEVLYELIDVYLTPCIKIDGKLYKQVL